MSEIKVDSLVNQSGDSDSGLDLTTNDVVAIKTANTERMRVDASGNVGIGTNSPDAMLHLKTASSPRLRLEDTTNSVKTDIFVGNTSSLIGNQSNHSFAIMTNDSARMTIESNGNWKYSGIGSGSGTYALKWNASTGAITFDTSARQVKDNIVDCSYGLSEVLQLQPRQYNRNDDGDKLEIGFVADEVSSLMPEFVPQVAESVFSGDDADTTMVAGGVHYDKMVAVLTKAIQEQNATITALEARLTALENA